MLQRNRRPHNSSQPAPLQPHLIVLAMFALTPVIGVLTFFGYGLLWAVFAVIVRRQPFSEAAVFHWFWYLLQDKAFLYFVLLPGGGLFAVFTVLWLCPSLDELKSAWHALRWHLAARKYDHRQRRQQQARNLETAQKLQEFARINERQQAVLAEITKSHLSTHLLAVSYLNIIDLLEKAAPGMTPQEKARLSDDVKLYLEELYVQHSVHLDELVAQLTAVDSARNGQERK